MWASVTKPSKYVGELPGFPGNGTSFDGFFTGSSTAQREGVPGGSKQGEGGERHRVP